MMVLFDAAEEFWQMAQTYDDINLCDVAAILRQFFTCRSPEERLLRWRHHGENKWIILKSVFKIKSLKALRFVLKYKKNNRLTPKEVETNAIKTLSCNFVVINSQIS